MVNNYISRIFTTINADIFQKVTCTTSTNLGLSAVLVVGTVFVARCSVMYVIREWTSLRLVSVLVAHCTLDRFCVPALSFHMPVIPTMVTLNVL